MFGVGARVPTRVLGPRYQLRALPVALGNGSMWGLKKKECYTVNKQLRCNGPQASEGCSRVDKGLSISPLSIGDF